MKKKNKAEKTIYELLPEGWREAAREEKALQRARNIGTAEELLRLNFLYQTTGESYGLTAALTQISEDQKSLNKTAVIKRITKSGPWLQWICEHLCLQEGYIAPPPEWLKEYRVLAVDASAYAAQGSKSADFRMHYLLELFTLNMVETHFTSSSEGEKMSRYEKLRENDLVLADRMYATMGGMDHILARKAQFLMRLKARAFQLYTAEGEKYDLTEKLKSGSFGEYFEANLYYKSGKEHIPVRVCALRKSEEAYRRSQEHSKKANRGRRPASELQSVWNRYVVVVTSLPDDIPVERLFELYRMRWQIELVFKRFKSIFGGGTFTARKEESVKAWFYGKLLIAILCEAIAKQAISPLGEDDEGQQAVLHLAERAIGV